MTERAGSLRTIDKAVDVIEFLAAADGEVSLTDLTRELGLPVATAHRLVRTLLARQLVRQCPDRRYELGPRLIHLGWVAGRQMGSWAKPHLEELAREIGESANLAELSGHRIVYVGQAQPTNMVRMFTEVGRAVLPHCTAVGKVIFAEMDPVVVEGILRANGMPALTANTIVDPEDFARELETVRQNGYAEDREEQELGVRCVAVRVPHVTGRLGLSVSGPKSRILALGMDRLVPLMHEVAERIGAEGGSHA